jgi:hypothetical protein
VTLTVRQTHDLTHARPLLERALRFDVYGTGGRLIDLIAGCLLFELVDGERVVGAFAARCESYSDGRVLTVTAAGGLPGYDLTAAIDDWMTSQARGEAQARRVQCVTRRRGLIKTLKARGYHEAGVILAKDLT